MTTSPEETPTALRLQEGVATPSQDDLTLARRALAAAAGGVGLVDVAYRTVDSPVGTLLLASTPRGLVRVAFDCEPPGEVLAELAGRISPRVLHIPAALDDAARQVDDYFAGRLTRFDLALDHVLSAGFRLDVQRHLVQIPYGERATYARVAGLAGRPTAVRAVGTACATNPLPIVQPCHRVVRSDGGIGGYRGGVEAKLVLLDLERRVAERTGEARPGQR